MLCAQKCDQAAEHHVNRRGVERRGKEDEDCLNAVYRNGLLVIVCDYAADVADDLDCEALVFRLRCPWRLTLVDVQIPPTANAVKYHARAFAI